MIYLKEGTNKSVRLTTNTQICEISPTLHISSIGDIRYSESRGMMASPDFIHLSNTLSCNVIHDRSQRIYVYKPIIDVKVYKNDTDTIRYEYVIVYAYAGTIYNIDNTKIKLKLAITSY